MWILPVYTVSEANLSEHWSKSSKRHKTQKTLIHFWFQNAKPKIFLPCIIKLTRISPRFLDDDNLTIAFKWIRDAIAENIFPGKAAGRADDSKLIKWQYDQIKGNPQSIKIELL